MRGLLDALHVPAARIPADLDAQAGLLRSLLSGRRMLSVADNARDACTWQLAWAIWPYLSQAGEDRVMSEEP